ncbi:DUF4230 domain-containing protein [Natronorubrum bangense]|uniref:Uncharacterized protein n=2 Tax=Natronorubrum bangense TaxID=61858 RepID=L9WKJ3_9EURY|nr:DUF4230 domain-containing protein [Natronorubrum bangense]ELY49907.1 hypothetical protein C494_07850 [Natronorubrum bangense JCM 10635]QCC55524.1 hypothetical protein DV706_14225 [Natronorubrum bangense]
MSEKELSNNGDEMARELPPFMPNDPSSPNYELLDVVGHAIDALEEDIVEVTNATTPQNATSIDQLFELAKLVDVNPKSEDCIDNYRPRVLNRFSLMTGEGTISDLLESIALILDVNISALQYSEDLENGVVVIEFPQAALDSTNLDQDELREIFNETVFAGYRVDLTFRGTFTYITPEDYDDAGFSHDSELGYDGLDEFGEPNGNGGTYSGILN